MAMPEGWHPATKQESPVLNFEDYSKLSIEEKKQQRFNVLHTIYKKSGGRSMYEQYWFEELILDLHVDKETARAILDYLMDEGLLYKDYNQFSAMLTHKGLLEVEQALSKPESPTEHFPAGSKPKPERQKVRILFVSANPRDTDTLELIKECNNVRDRLISTEYGDQFDFDQRHEVSVSEIDRYLLDYKPQVLHFSGHGSSDGIVFQDSDKEVERTSIRALSDLFRIVNEDESMTDDTRVRLVFLSACYSQKQAETISKHVDCVIGMSAAVTDEAARVFAESFYQAIGFGKSIKTAFDLGCNKVARLNISEAHTPKLLNRQGIDPSSIYLARISSNNNG
jgi:predicted transcriptional regulator